MAKEPKSGGAAKGKAGEGDKAQGGDGKGFIIALVVLTLVGGGGGFFFGNKVLKSNGDSHAVAAAGKAEEPPKEGAKEGEHESGHGSGHGEKDAKEAMPSGELVQLAPIITNLAQPSGKYIRLEGAILVEPGYADAKILAAQVGEDVIMLLKTLVLAQIQGASGLNHLREDINERVRVRSEGKAHEFIIQSLVVE